MQLVRRPNRNQPAYGRLFENFFNDDFFQFPTKTGTNLRNSTLPAVNVKEDENQFDLELAIPGKTKEDISIDLKEDILTISSESKSSNEEKEGDKWTRREFEYSSFTRSFYLPDSVDGSKIKANYADGILRLTIPKKEEAKPQPAREIKIS